MKIQPLSRLKTIVTYGVGLDSKYILRKETITLYNTENPPASQPRVCVPVCVSGATQFLLLFFLLPLILLSYPSPPFLFSSIFHFFFFLHIIVIYVPWLGNTWERGKDRRKRECLRLALIMSCFLGDERCSSHSEQ